MAKKSRKVDRLFGVLESSGNVFSDLGYIAADETLAKTRLAFYISTLIENKALTQIEAAVLLGIDQPKISRISKGQVREFSMERLLRFIATLGEKVELVVRSPRNSKKRRSLRIHLYEGITKLRGRSAA